jgi:gliding motility-associated lipoprotein GldD
MLNVFIHPFHHRTIFKWLAVLFLITVISCQNREYYPKPRGYFRIDLPEKSYRSFDSVFPYRFEYPTYARLNFEGLQQAGQYWMNLDYPRFDGRIHISYKALDGRQLFNFTEDAREMAFKHAPKAISIKESYFSHPEKKVFGLAFEIEGRDAASPYQFYLTDSTRHFLRGALYFNVAPNNDSLQPVINFIMEDVKHIFDTFEWKMAKSH